MEGYLYLKFGFLGKKKKLKYRYLEILCVLGFLVEFVVWKF